MDEYFNNLSTKVDYLIEILEKKDTGTVTARKPMDVAEAANYLNLKKQGIYNRVHLGTIPHHKNGKLFFYQEELEAFINGSWKPSLQK